MKIFLDTNVFTEYIEERPEVETVAKILEAVADGKHQGCLSQGGFYTLAFLLEKTLKRKDMHRLKLSILSNFVMRSNTFLLTLLCAITISAQSIKTTCTKKININQSLDEFSLLDFGDSVTIYSFKEKNGFYFFNIETERYAGLMRTNDVPFDVTEKELKRLPDALGDKQKEFIQSRKLIVEQKIAKERRERVFSGAYKYIISNSYALTAVNGTHDKLQKGDTVSVVGYKKGRTDDLYALFNDKIAGIYTTNSYPFTVLIKESGVLPSIEDPDVQQFIESKRREIMQRKVEEKVNYRNKVLKGEIKGVLCKGDELECVEDGTRPFENGDTVSVLGYSKIDLLHYFALYSDANIGIFRSTTKPNHLFKDDSAIDFEILPSYDDPEVKYVLKEKKPEVDSVGAIKRSEFLKKYEETATSLIKVYKDNEPFIVEVDSWSSNSAGGITVRLTITNCSSNTIKYANFQGYFKNAVGDKCYNEIGGGTVWKARGIGPIGPRPTTVDNCLERMYDCKASYSFDNISFYSRVANTFHLSSVNIQYMNGKTVTLTGANLEKHVKY